MFSIETIRAMNAKAARDSLKRKDVPLLLEASTDIRKVPNLGTRVPKGWRYFEPSQADMLDCKALREEDGSYLVDSSGFGRPGEPAYTFGEFETVCADIAQWSAIRERDIGIGIVSQGQFQIVIQLFIKGGK